MSELNPVTLFDQLVEIISNGICVFELLPWAAAMGQMYYWQSPYEVILES